MCLGIPYMGSKRRLSKRIVDYILDNNPRTEYVHDLFGGGGAISFEFLQRRQIKQVFYNELNTGVVELLKKIKNDGATAEFYQWVDREIFHAHKKDDGWYGGLLKTCWSFGNNQRSYLFSKENEALKKPLHNIVVNKCEKSIQEFYELSGLLVDKSLLQKDSINSRRLNVMNFIKKAGKRIDLEHLARLQHLERLERLEHLRISNKSAFDVEILTPADKTIIYLDPPYFGTSEYAEKICHDELYSWIEKNSHYKIYMSSYDSHLFECTSFKHNTTVGPKGKKEVAEKLFCNREEIYLDRLF